MNKEITEYNKTQTAADQQIANLLARILDTELDEDQSKIWHAHPVWFLDGNPIAGYSREKAGMRLMFWSGADFDEAALNVRGKKFKDASIFYNDSSEVIEEDLKRWIGKAKEIQWDYKNIVKRKGKLERL